MINIVRVFLAAFFLSTLVSAAVQAKEDEPSNAQRSADIAKLQKHVKRAKTNHRVGKVQHIKDDKKRKLVKRYKRLNKRVLNDDGTQKANTYVVQYAKLNRDLDIFAAGPGGAEGGIASCMGDCGDEFPGVGGGAGVNRAACKIACLVHGGDNS